MKRERKKVEIIGATEFNLGCYRQRPRSATIFLESALAQEMKMNFMQS
jgi:hypothetical protein